MSGLIEQEILSAIESFLTGRVNELLQNFEFQIAPIEFSDLWSGTPAGVGTVEPVVQLAECERSEKERIVRVDTYSLTVSLNVPEGPDSERDAYTYGAAIGTAFGEDPTLGGVVDRAVLTGKKYTPPKMTYCGEGWQAVFTLRLTVEAPFGKPNGDAEKQSFSAH